MLPKQSEIGKVHCTMSRACESSIIYYSTWPRTGPCTLHSSCQKFNKGLPQPVNSDLTSMLLCSRLYSCLSNGSADEFNKGDHLYKARAVRDALQIGTCCFIRLHEDIYVNKMKIIMKKIMKKIIMYGHLHPFTLTHGILLHIFQDTCSGLVCGCPFV